jgi:hypothetical protein
MRFTGLIIIAKQLMVAEQYNVPFKHYEIEAIAKRFGAAETFKEMCSLRLAMTLTFPN